MTVVLKTNLRFNCLNDHLLRFRAKRVPKTLSGTTIYHHGKLEELQTIADLKKKKKKKKDA